MDYWAEREEDFVDVKYSSVSCIRPSGLGVEARNLDASGYADGTILAVVGGRMSERQILPTLQIADRTVDCGGNGRYAESLRDVHEHFRIVIEVFRGGAARGFYTVAVSSRTKVQLRTNTGGASFVVTVCTVACEISADCPCWEILLACYAMEYLASSGPGRRASLRRNINIFSCRQPEGTEASTASCLPYGSTDTDKSPRRQIR